MARTFQKMSQQERDLHNQASVLLGLRVKKRALVPQPPANTLRPNNSNLTFEERLKQVRENTVNVAWENAK